MNCTTNPNCSAIVIRLGPSASQRGGDENKLSEVLKAVQVIQAAMQEPWAQALLGQGQGIGAPGSEKKDAEDGKPAPSKPATPVPPPGESKVPPEEIKVPVPPSEKNEMPPPSAIPPKKDRPVEGIINSSTHRQSHARLTRKMQSLGEAECPNMTKLWNGSRKDSEEINMKICTGNRFGFCSKNRIVFSTWQT